MSRMLGPANSAGGVVATIHAQVRGSRISVHEAREFCGTIWPAGQEACREEEALAVGRIETGSKRTLRTKSLILIAHSIIPRSAHAARERIKVARGLDGVKALCPCRVKRYSCASYDEQKA
jgi:hypothetical protein